MLKLKMSLKIPGFKRENYYLTAFSHL